MGAPDTRAQGGGRDDGLGRRMAMGSLAGMAANVVFLATRLVLTPFILHYVTLADFGLWSVCFIILSYAGLSAFGVQNAYVKYAAEYCGRGDMESTNALLGTGMTLMGGLCLVVYLMLYAGVPWVMDHFGIEPRLKDLAGFMILGTAAVFLADLVFGAFRNLLEGVQEIALVRGVWLAATLVETGLVFVFLPLGLGIRGVFWAYAVKTGFELAVGAVLAFRRLPGLRLRPRVERGALNALLVFGGKVQLLGVLGIFLGTFDRIVSTSLLGLEATGLFEVGRKLPFTGRSITGAAFAPFLPAAAGLGGIWHDSPVPTARDKARKYGALCLSAVGLAASSVAVLLFLRWRAAGTGAGDPLLLGAAGFSVLAVWPGIPALRRVARLMRGGEMLESHRLRDMYLNGCRHINLVNFILYAFMAAAAPELLLAWVGPDYGGAVPILLLVAATSLVHLATGAGTALFRGINRSGRELEYTLVQLVLSLVWAPGLAWAWGLVGLVLGSAAATILSSLYFIQRTNQAFRIGLGRYLRHAVLPGLAPVLAGGAVFLGLRVFPLLTRWQTLGLVTGAGMAYLVLTAFLLRAWFLSPEEWRILTAPVARVMARSGA